MSCDSRNNTKKLFFISTPVPVKKYVWVGLAFYIYKYMQ